jgi:hypothetical protein
MNAKHIIATERDLAILSFTGKAGIVSLGQLHHRFWPEALESTARSRLKLLERAGWITGHRLDARQPGEHVFTITAKGARENFTRPERDRFIIGLPLKSELKHLLYAQDARLLLKNALAARGFILMEWQNEREIRAEQTGIPCAKLGIPDARATFVNHSSGEQIVFDIEIDTGQYFGKMLALKIDAYVKQVERLIIWATLPGRVKRLEAEIKARQAKHIQVIGLPVPGLPKCGEKLCQNDYHF